MGKNIFDKTVNPNLYYFIFKLRRIQLEFGWKYNDI